MSNELDLSKENLAKAIADFVTALGGDAVLTSPGDIREYRDPYAFKESDARDASAILMPASVEDVQAVVKIAGRYQVPLWTFGQGRNYTYGGPAPRLRGSVLVNLRRMNRILEVNHDLAYAVVEPGVRWFDLHDALGEGGRRLWHSTPDLGWGSVIGNTLEYGRGYTPHGDHAMNVCGLEVVLPDGELLRTGMGAMAKSRAWHVYPHGYGPSMNGLFMQSNLGIVTKMGFGLLPRPEAYACGSLKFDGDDKLAAVIDVIRGLMLEGTIVGYPLMRCGYAETGEPLMSGSCEEWGMRFSLYGRREIVEANVRIVARALAPVGEIQTRIYTSDDKLEVEDHDVRVQGGVPGLTLLDVFNTTFGEHTGHLDLSPVLPLIGSELREMVRMQRSAYAAHGYPYHGVFLLAPRSAIHIGTTFYDATDEAMTRKAYDVYGKMAVELAQAGYPIYRTSPEHMDLVAEHFDFGDQAMRRFQETIKDAVDPDGILSPGKQGIWPRSLRHREGLQGVNRAMADASFRLGAERIAVSVLTSRDVEDAACALTEVFTEREPLSLALELRYGEMKGFSRMMCEQAARSGLSFVAKNADGRIVAFSVAEKWPAHPLEGAPLEEVFPRQAPIFALLGQCEAWFDAAYAGDNEALHILVIGATKGYEGRGITKRVVADTLTLARERGFSRTYTEATSVSHRLFSSLGFETRHEIVYQDFTFGGGRPFASITSVPSTKLMVYEAARREIKRNVSRGEP